MPITTDSTPAKMFHSIGAWYVRVKKCVERCTLIRGRFYALHHGRNKGFAAFEAEPLLGRVFPRQEALERDCPHDIQPNELPVFRWKLPSARWLESFSEPVQLTNDQRNQR